MKSTFFLIFTLFLWRAGAQLSLDTLAVEGVYEVETKSKTKLNITLLKNLSTQNMHLSISGRETNLSYFFSSNAQISKKSVSLFEVTAGGVDFNGVRSMIRLAIDLATMKVEGVIQGNFLADGASIEFSGAKLDSVYELISFTSYSSCGAIQKYFGTYQGQFVGQGLSTFHINEFPNQNGEPSIAASITTASGTRFLYHDGVYDQALELLIVFNNRSFFPPGKAKKLILRCSETANNLILEGVHINNTGRVIRDIIFSKPK